MSANPAATAAPRPMLAAPTVMNKAKKIEKIADIFNNPDVTGRLRDVMPKHLTPERMLRMLATALRTTPKLNDCDPVSLLGAVMTCSYVGLEPNTPLGHAYLIPFEKKRFNKQTKQWEVERVDVQLIFGYRGLIDLARRGGELVSIHADVAYKGDLFEFEYGSNMRLKHVPLGDSQGRAAEWAYAHAKLVTGEAFEVLPYARVMRIRDATQGYSAARRAIEDAENDDKQKWRAKTALETPWIKHEHEMAAKTMIRRISKMLPMSLEKLHYAAAIDGAGEAGHLDFSKVGMLGGSEFDPSLAIDHSDETPIDTMIDGDYGPGGEMEMAEAGQAQEQRPPQAQPARQQERPRQSAKPRQQAAPPPQQQEPPPAAEDNAMGRGDGAEEEYAGDPPDEPAPPPRAAPDPSRAAMQRNTPPSQRAKPSAPPQGGLGFEDDQEGTV